MPWKAMTTMSQRQEFVELALKENANVRALCRKFGITPRTGYKWIKRYQEQERLGCMIVAVVHSIAHSKVVQSWKKLCLKCDGLILLGETERSNGINAGRNKATTPCQYNYCDFVSQ